MDQVARFEASHKPAKRLKAGVAQIFSIPQLVGRGVGQEDIEVAPVTEAVKEEAGDKFENPPIHLEIGVLVLPAVVLH